VTGSEPLDYCDVHQPSLFKKIFGFGTVKAAEPAPIDITPVQPRQTATAEGSTNAEKAEAKSEGKDKETEASGKKRGFWSRIFHGSSGK
jgi:hypothetical protein